MKLSQLDDLLSHEDQLQNMVNDVNRSRVKAGKAELSIEVLRTEYTIAKAIEEAKEAGETETARTKTQELIAHQENYGL